MQASQGIKQGWHAACMGAPSSAAPSIKHLRTLHSSLFVLSSRHLAKGAEQIKKDQAASLAALQRKIDLAKVSSSKFACWSFSVSVSVSVSEPVPPGRQASPKQEGP